MPSLYKRNNTLKTKKIRKIQSQNKWWFHKLNKQFSLKYDYFYSSGSPWWGCLQWGRPGYDLCVGKILWRRKWQPTQIFLPGESHGHGITKSQTRLSDFNLFYSSLIISLCWAKASSWKRKLIFPMIFESHRYRYLELQIMISMPWYDHSSRAQHPRMEVKWALGSITMNKASRGDGISAELFHILKDDALKVRYSICQQVWKTQQWVFIGPGKINFHSNPKERQCQRMFKLLYNCIHLTR